MDPYCDELLTGKMHHRDAVNPLLPEHGSSILIINMMGPLTLYQMTKF